MCLETPCLVSCNSVTSLDHIINTLVIRGTILHDLSVLAIRRTMQINSRPTKIIYFGSKVAICACDEFD